MSKRVAFFVAGLLIPLLLGCAGAGKAEGPGPAGVQQNDQFCGTSTGGPCSSDGDCVRAGCSRQVCQSASEAKQMTTCEFRDCFDAARYNLSCGCVRGACQWKQ